MQALCSFACLDRNHPPAVSFAASLEAVGLHAIKGAAHLLSVHPGNSSGTNEDVLEILFCAALCCRPAHR